MWRIKSRENYIVSNLRLSNKDLKTSVKIAVSISNLLHETQKERGATAGFIGSKGKAFVKKLPAQRLLTNKKLAIVKNTLNRLGTKTLNVEAKSSLQKALNKLDKLNTIRSSVDKFSIGAKEAIRYYTSINTSFLNVVGAIAKDATNKYEARDLSAWYNFIMAKERGGI